MYEDDEPEDLEPQRGLISGLWAEWVVVCCDRDGGPRPTAEEWDWMKSRFYLEKAPLTSWEELKQRRKEAANGHDNQQR